MQRFRTASFFGVKDTAILSDNSSTSTSEKKKDAEESGCEYTALFHLTCEQALCLGKNSEEREGKGGERACRQTFEAAIPPLVIILPIICQ